MSILLKLCFLFFVGSVSGWVAELLFRRFFSSANPERKWINPGFCIGPYLPLYGVGLCLLYLIAALGEHCLPGNAPWRDALLIVLMGAAMTATEYIAGILSLRVMKVRLWDYSHNFGNIQGIICPKFSCIWTALGAGFYFLIHLHILGALRWLSDNLAFSFVIGLFFGVFAVDVAHSMQLAAKLKKFAEENDVVVRFENMKAAIRRHQEQTAQKYHFFRPFHSERPLAEQLKNMREAFENRRKKPPKT